MSEPFDLATGPLWRFELLDIGEVGEQPEVVLPGLAKHEAVKHAARARDRLLDGDRAFAVGRVGGGADLVDRGPRFDVVEFERG